MSVVGIRLARRGKFNAGVCDEPKLVDIRADKGNPIRLSLVDSNDFQYFPASISMTRSVRLTVVGTEGASCDSGSIGFGEIEILGTPVGWSLRPKQDAPDTLQLGAIPPASIKLHYASNVPADAQAYIAQLYAQVEPILQEMLGPPLQDQTLAVALDPTVGAFSYEYPWLLTISRLPRLDLTPADPANWDFNANFVHELVHAHQGPFVKVLPSWFLEGFAQAATDLVKQVLRERGTPLIQHDTMDEGAAIRTYDILSRVGPEVLSTQYRRPGRFLTYINAEGLWWLLLLSQSRGEGDSAYASLDYFRRVQQALPASKGASSDSAWHEMLARISRRPIDGLPVRTWLARQPAAVMTSAPFAFGLYPSDCICPGASSAKAQYLIVVLQRGGVSLNGTRVRIAIMDQAGNPISDEVEEFRDYGFGFWRYTIPTLIDKLSPGRYDIAAETQVDGRTIRATNVLPIGSNTISASDRIGIYRALADSLRPLNLEASTGRFTRTSASTGVLGGWSGQPRGDIVLRSGDRPSTESVFVPSPYTRVLGIP